MTRTGGAVLARALIVVLAASVVVGCGRPDSRAVRTAHGTEAHGDGYRRADQPEAIADLLAHYAGQNGGRVIAREVFHGDRPGGHVDVLFVNEGGGFTPTTVECWRFAFRKPDGDAYVREIDFDEIDCPSTR